MSETAVSSSRVGKPLFVLFGFYLIAQGLTLAAGNALFWDGHALVQLHEKGELQAIFDAAGFSIFGYVHSAALGISPGFARLLSFVLHFGAGAFLYRIIGILGLLDRREQILVVIFFLVLPLNFARISIINLQYAGSLFLFFVAWWMWCRYEQHGGIFYRAAALPLFVLSFFTQSLLVFFIWPFLAAWHVSGCRLFGFALARIELTIAPPVFFLLYRTFSAPTGDFATYNEIMLSGTLLTGPLAVIWSGFINLDINVYLLLVCLAISALLVQFAPGLCKSATKIHAAPVKISTAMMVTLSAGFIATALAPYLLVGKLPLFQGWASRHQLLLPLGIALILTAILRIPTPHNRCSWATFFIAICLATNLSGYWQYMVDVIKQDAFVASAAEIPAIKNGRIFPVTDRTQKWNAFDRQYNVTEFDSLFKRGFDDNINRLAQARDYGSSHYRSNIDFARLISTTRNYYLAGEDNISTDSLDCEIIIDEGSRPLSMKDQILFFGRRLVNSPNYGDAVGVFLKVECRPLLR